MRNKINLIASYILIATLSIFFLSGCKDSKSPNSKIPDSRVYELSWIDFLAEGQKYYGKKISLICNLSNAGGDVVWCEDPSNTMRKIYISSPTFINKEQLKWALRYCGELNMRDNGQGCWGVKTMGVYTSGLGRLEQAEFTK